MLLNILIGTLTLTSAENIRGVSPSKQAFYLSDNGLFRCLDGSGSIPSERINDDYCDCRDGSDEPGTSACHNGTFFCQNAGHIPAYVPSSRVNDGACESVCCDGSDEWLGIIKCPNTCKEQAKVHAKTEKERNAIESAGFSVKQQWTKEAQQIRLDVQHEITRKEVALGASRINLADKETAFEKVKEESVPEEEDLQDVESERNLETLRSAITSFEAHTASLQQRINELEAIMKSMAESYNPNFQDMAVKGAVTSFNELSAIEPVTAEFTELLDAVAESAKASQSSSDKTIVPTGLNGILHRMRMSLIEFGVLQGDNDVVSEKGETKQVANLREALEKLREEISESERDINSLKASLSENFGENDVYRAVKGQCFSSLISDYTYEVCLLETLQQKSSSSSTLVGNYDHVDENGSLVYNGGHKCWNGPERSGRVDIECGSKNELLSVREAQKCEYVFRIRSPLACKGAKSTQRDEL